MAPQRKALLVATYGYQDPGLRRLVAPAHDAEALAAVLRDPDVAGFEVTVLLNEPAHVVGEAIGDFYGGCRRDDLTLLYFSGHGLKDDDGRLYLAMTNTRRDALLFTGLPAASISDAMDGCPSRRKVLVLDCCYSGAFPAGRTAKADSAVHTLERFQGRGRAVLTASDATSYSFDGDELTGSGSRSVFTRYLVEAMRSGAADLDDDGDITLDELYSWVRDRVVAEMPQQRPKKQEDVEGRIVLAQNVAWELPRYLRYGIDSPIAAQRLVAVDGLGDLYLRGNGRVRDAVERELTALSVDDSHAVSTAATALLVQLKVVTVTSGGDGGTETSGGDGGTVTSGGDGGTETSGGDGGTETSRGEVGPPPPPPPPPAAVPLVLGLVVVSALPLTLSRLLTLEENGPYTADGWSESTKPWTLAVVLPLVLAALGLALWRRLPGVLAPAVGFVLGTSFVLTETAAFWAAFFVEQRATLDPGPALWWLFAGWAVVVAAAVTAVTRTPLAGRPSLRRDWRLSCAVVALGAVLVAATTVAEAASAWVWIENNARLVVLAVLALALTVLRWRRDQAVAGLVAVTVLALWLIYFFVRDYVLQFGIEPPKRMTEIVCVVVTVVACAVAQAGTLRSSSASPASR